MYPYFNKIIQILLLVFSSVYHVYSQDTNSINFNCKTHCIYSNDTIILLNGFGGEHLIVKNEFLPDSLYTNLKDVRVKSYTYSISARGIDFHSYRENSNSLICIKKYREYKKEEFSIEIWDIFLEMPDKSIRRYYYPTIFINVIY